MLVKEPNTKLTWKEQRKKAIELLKSASTNLLAVSRREGLSSSAPTGTRKLVWGPPPRARACEIGRVEAGVRHHRKKRTQIRTYVQLGLADAPLTSPQALLKKT